MRPNPFRCSLCAKQPGAADAAPVPARVPMRAETLMSAACFLADLQLSTLDDGLVVCILRSCSLFEQTSVRTSE